MLLICVVIFMYMVYQLRMHVCMPRATYASGWFSAAFLK